MGSEYVSLPAGVKYFFPERAQLASFGLQRDVTGPYAHALWLRAELVSPRRGTELLDRQASTQDRSRADLLAWGIGGSRCAHPRRVATRMHLVVAHSAVRS
jgi:hypothetical protein